MSNKAFIITLFVLIAEVKLSYSQQVVATSGGSDASSSIQMEYTIGETIVNTGSNSSNTLTQGFQQPSITIESVETLEEGFEASFFPNPTASILHLSTNTEGEYNVDVYDVSGKRVESTNDMFVDFSPFPSATYIVRISDKQGKALKQATIIKQ